MTGLESCRDKSTTQQHGNIARAAAVCCIFACYEPWPHNLYIVTIIVSVISSPSHFFNIALHLEAQLRGRCSVQASYCALLTRVTTARLPGRPLIGHLLPAVPPPIGQLAGAESGSGQEMWSTNTGQLSRVLGILYILCHLLDSALYSTCILIFLL